MIRVLHLRQGSGLYGADRAVLALSAATPAPFECIVGAIARPGSAASLAEEARRRGLDAVIFESARRFDLACVRAVARTTRPASTRRTGNRPSDTVHSTRACTWRIDHERPPSTRGALECRAWTRPPSDG